jgi:hypothetical protein
LSSSSLLLLEQVFAAPLEARAGQLAAA